MSKSTLSRRSFVLGTISALFTGFVIQPKVVWAKQYLTPEQAKSLIWADKAFTPTPIELSDAQRAQIEDASSVRVRNKRLNAFRSEDGCWFILDQVVGKHEFVDIAVGIDAEGRVKGIEILEYRETYGYEVANPKWRAQFVGRDHSEHLKVDEQIKNISGATLSCVHITDGINRLTHTWAIVLKQIS